MGIPLQGATSKILCIDWLIVSVTAVSSVIGHASVQQCLCIVYAVCGCTVGRESTDVQH